MKHIPAIIITPAILIIQLSISGLVNPGDSEAYYYSWSNKLDLSYYDHPAGIAYLIRLSTHLFGHNPFALRFFSTIFINLSLIIIYTITYIYTGDNKKALFSILFFISMPAFLIGGVSASPEPPLIFFSSAGLLFFLLYVLKKRDIYLYLSFIISGFGINIKYTELILICGYLFILIRREMVDRKRLLILAIILFVFSLPIIIWNIKHSGISFSYHLIQRTSLSSIPLNILKFVIGQLLYFNPIIVILMTFIVIKRIKQKGFDLFTTLFTITLLISAIPMLIIKNSEPHWSSLIYLPASILCSEDVSRYRRWIIFSLGINILLFGIFIFHLFSPLITETILKNQDPRYDITNELFGWDLVSENIEYIIQNEHIPEDKVLLLSNHYTMAGQLMFATKSRYRVACRGKRCNQFSIDDIRDERGYKLFIFVTDNRYREIPDLYKRDAIEEKLKIYRGEKKIREFHLFVKKPITQ